jgi:hypothetical protein
MTNTIFSDLFDQATPAASPQLRDPTRVATGATRLGLDDHELGGAAVGIARPPSLLPVIKAIAAQMEASEARARFAESQLAAHGRHCICRAADIAADEAGVVSGLEVGSASLASCDAVDAVDAHESGISLAA